ncbi:MAG: response regulator [Patescibacteria group bacterium]
MKTLIVEDDEAISRLLCQAIEAKLPNAEIHVAKSTFRVHAYLHPQELFDYIFWDGKIEGGNTLQLLEVARIMFPNCKMIAMSGDLQQEQRSRGCDVSLNKPFVTADIHAVLDVPLQ